MRKFLAFLTLLLILPTLNAAVQVWRHEDPIPEFRYSHKFLTKPADMSPAQWVDALETERDKADAAGEITTHFESYTKEISVTLAGKYGEVETSPAKLVYSIMRTRHKFPGKGNMLTDFYGVTETTTITPQQITILAIDTMLAKEINSSDEAFGTQWATVNAENSASPEFIQAVMQYAQYGNINLDETMEVQCTAIEKGCAETGVENPIPQEFSDAVRKYTREKNLSLAVEVALEQFLTTHSTTIALAKKVFDIFVPIHGNLIFSGEYKGWKAHSTSTIGSLINFSPEGKEQFAEQERQINARILDLASKNLFPEIYHRSAMADVASEEITMQLGLAPNTLILEYMYDPTVSLFFPAVPKGEGIMRVFFTREADPEIAELLGRSYAKISAKMLTNIYAAILLEANKRTAASSDSKLIGLLVKAGNAQTIRHVSAWLYEGKHGFPKDLAQAVKFCRKASDLGDKQAEGNLPEMLWGYSSILMQVNAESTMKMEEKIEKIDQLVKKAMKLKEEAKMDEAERLEHEAQEILKSVQEESACLTQDRQNYQKLMKEAASLGHKMAQLTIAQMPSSAI